MSSQFTVCTYNIGTGLSEYKESLTHSKSPILKDGTDKQIASYNRTQEEAAKILNGQAEVFCLQEVGSTDRPLIKSFVQRGFTVIRCEGMEVFDSAVVLDTRRFKDITNHSFEAQITKSYKKDVAVATATDIKTGQQVAFVSAHVPGFPYNGGSFTNVPLPINQEITSAGDILCRAIVDKLSQVASGTIHIIGADMNCSPEKWNPRFEIFKQKNLKLIRTNAFTNLIYSDIQSDEKQRELDFIFTSSSSIWQRIKSIFFSIVEIHSSVKLLNPLGWDVDRNASDHLPVFATVDLQRTDSKIYQLWSWVRDGFKSCIGGTRREVL